MDYLSSELAAKYLRPRKTPSTACSGCGLGANHKIIIQAVFELGWFARVEMTTSATEGGVVLVYTVVENPVIAARVRSDFGE